VGSGDRRGVFCCFGIDQHGVEGCPEMKMARVDSIATKSGLKNTCKGMRFSQSARETQITALDAIFRIYVERG